VAVETGATAARELRAGVQPFGVLVRCRRIYDWNMENRQFFPDGFSAAIVAAGSRARLETLKAGIAVFYRDREHNLDVMEQPDGRRFEVRFIAGAPLESN
jgi:hypothetical protein